MKVDLRRPRRFYGALGKCYCVTTLSKLAFVALHAIDYRCVLTFLSASFCSVVGPGFYRLSMLILLCFFLNVLQNVLCKDQLFKFKICYIHIFIKIIYICKEQKHRAIAFILFMPEVNVDAWHSVQSNSSYGDAAALLWH